jgi:hypothetical protein
MAQRETSNEQPGPLFATGLATIPEADNLDRVAGLDQRRDLPRDARVTRVVVAADDAYASRRGSLPA